MRTRVTLALAGAAFGCSAMVSQALAQTAPPTRIRGQIETVDGAMLVIKSRSGEAMTVKLADHPRLMALVKASLADIKPGTYIGVTGMPQQDGSEKAIAIHIFPESMRGVGEGHRPWDRAPGSTMTNAAVEQMVTGVDGEVLTVKYTNSEMQVIVAPDTPIVAYMPGAPDDIKPGAQVMVPAATRQPDGTFTAPGISIGRGVTPPM